MNEKRKKFWAIKRKVNRFSSLIYMRVHRYLTLHPELLQSEEGKRCLTEVKEGGG